MTSGFILLICAVLFGQTFIFGSDQKVTFLTADRIALSADYIPPKGKNPVVVMLHGIGSSRGEWKPLIDVLTQKGWGSFAYDLRGHGESSRTKDAGGAPDEYKAFGPPSAGSPWLKMVDDLGAAMVFLSKEMKIERKRIFIAGASFGANVAVKYASLSSPVRGVLLLSPGSEYAGITAKDAVEKIGNLPVLIITSEADAYAFSSSQKLKSANPAVKFWSGVKPGHGVQMFDEPLLSRILIWLTRPE